MRCIYCNTPLSAIDYCTGCGADITIQKRIGRISNLLYNEGLEKARVRDLEGAISCLKRSLKFNKENIDARNLLGLCYMETGEVVSALCEWVISKNMKASDNLADYYIDLLQSNKNRLDVLNQTIRKYNQSVTYCREDNEDMAIIQLKKVLSQNPGFVRAYQLLALLYMKRQEYERARKLLKKAARVDMTNTTTLRYLQEIEDATGKSTRMERRRRWKEWGKAAREQKEEAVTGTLRYMSGTEMVIQPTTFRDSSAIATFINIIFGMLLGGAVVWFLVVPANRQSVNDDANRIVTDANTKLASESARVQDLEDEIDGYLQQVEEANLERDDALAKAESYDDLLGIASTYIGGDETSTASMISELDAEQFEGNAQTLYQALSGAVQASVFTQAYLAGTQAYASGNYAAAITQLEEAIESDPERAQSSHADALWYLAYAYYNQGDQTKAGEVFAELVQYFPNYQYASQAQSYASAMGASASGDGGAPQEANLEDLSGINATAPDQTAGDGTAQSTEESQAAGGEASVSQYGDGTWGQSDIAWTDPNTGIHYDMYGNELPGQR